MCCNHPDLDVDSQTDGANAVISGPDSESESDMVEAVDGEDDPLETLYVHSPEAEFGAVSAKLERFTPTYLITCQRLCAGWRASRRTRRREQESHLVRCEASSAGNGSEQGRSAYVHP